MILAQDLRDAVLQAALQGKLTEQLDTDSKVSDLLMSIEKCREPLKMCKNSLNLESMNIKIPCQWKMVELNSILSFIDYRGKTPNKSAEGIFLITASNIKKGYMDYTRKEYISKEEYDNRQSRGITKKGDLLFTTEAPLGNVSLCDLEISSCGQRVITMQAYCENTVCLELFMYFLLSPAFQKELTDNCTGTTAKGIKAEKLKHLLIPFPPIEEQQRIVDRVNELMEKIDEYEKVEKELLALEQRFPNDMKNALLQAAMQGELTKQLDSDSSVDEMLDAIKEEKEQLIKEKKIKKEKSLLPIEEDEIPFDIPINWKWIRLAQIGEIIGGGTPKTTESVYWENGSIPWITPADMNGCEMFIGKGNKSITREGLANSSAQLIPKNSVIISSRAPIGYIAISENELTTSQGCKTFSAYNKTKILSKYIYFVIIYSTSDLIKRATGTTFKEISAKGVGETIIPLPPIEEQQRIVERLEQLLPLCETL